MIWTHAPLYHNDGDDDDDHNIDNGDVDDEYVEDVNDFFCLWQPLSSAKRRTQINTMKRNKKTIVQRTTTKQSKESLGAALIVIKKQLASATCYGD